MRHTSFIALIVLSLGVVGYAVEVYVRLPLGAAVHPDMRATFEGHARLAIYTHVFASPLALALGPFQFATRLRAALPVLHRWSGRLYLGLGVLTGGFAGLYAAFNAFGGAIARAGFVCLAAAWLFSGFKAYQAVRSGDVASHRRWMVRNFSLTFAAVALRLWLPGLVASGASMAVAYPVVAWLCWVPNMIVAELLFNKTHNLAAQPTPAGGRG